MIPREPMPRARPPRSPVSMMSWLALACLAVALVRTRRSLREVQSRGRADPRPRTDDLTGLANRRAFVEGLDLRLRGAEPTAVLIVDLNGFKEVNDRFGHSAGDFLLQATAARLQLVPDGARAAARFASDAGLQNYVELEGGGKPAFLK